MTRLFVKLAMVAIFGYLLSSSPTAAQPTSSGEEG